VAALPPALRRRCHVSGSGELFWFGHAAAEAAEWFAHRGRVILGGEVYRRHAVGWATYVSSWEVTPDTDLERSSIIARREIQRALRRDDLHEILIFLAVETTDVCH
jgi:hypothetical protein